MSFDTNNLGTFTATKYGSGNSKSRMAGDYLSEFTKKYSDNTPQKQTQNRSNFNTSQKQINNTSNSNTSKGNNENTYKTNTEKMLFGDTENKPTASKPAASQPAASQPAASQPVATPAGGIDYAAWAKESVANDPTSAAAGADAAWWEKTYRRNNAEYEQNKALMASHQGPKTWDELAARSKARSGTGDVVSRNTGSISDYESYTKYATAQQNVKQWEESSSKWRT